ncbi:hypothetical protein [Yoonia sp.]|uniref:hypothetical protein n=1 Tax=Yoonia sp. TaxID=2212373 RepID=UPI00391C2CF3
MVEKIMSFLKVSYSNGLRSGLQRFFRMVFKSAHIAAVQQSQDVTREAIRMSMVPPLNSLVFSKVACFRAIIRRLPSL